MGVGLVAGPDEGGVGLGRKGSDWARFLGREGRERPRLAEHGHDGKAAIFAMF
jgi:hypothetical protein